MAFQWQTAILEPFFRTQQQLGQEDSLELVIHDVHESIVCNIQVLKCLVVQLNYLQLPGHQTISSAVCIAEGVKILKHPSAVSLHCIT